MTLSLILIFITTSISSEDMNLISETYESEINNMTDIECSVRGLKLKHESFSPMSEISKKIKCVTLNEFDEKHKYFKETLNKDNLESMDEEK